MTEGLLEDVNAGARPVQQEPDFSALMKKLEASDIRSPQDIAEALEALQQLEMGKLKTFLGLLDPEVREAMGSALKGFGGAEAAAATRRVADHRSRRPKV